MCYVDGDTGGGVIASSANCIDCDGVFSAGIQFGDGGSGLSAWDINLPRSLATWEDSKEGPSVKLVWLTLEETKNSKILVQTSSCIGDPVVSHWDRGSIPAYGDGGWGGSCYH